MGNLCLAGKEPEREDRQRLVDSTVDIKYGTRRMGSGSSSTAGGATGRSGPIGVPEGRGRGGNGGTGTAPSTSYTEARMEEQGFFESIIRRTENDLLSTQEGLSGIDVPHDASELSRLFAIHDRGTAAGGGAARLPTSVITPDTLAATLKRPVLAGTDMADLQHALVDITEAVKGMHVEHRADVVISMSAFIEGLS
eukprot:m.66572 g.66572  ORF g.66572 m.66572 type:complete len:196 (-) comp8369_c0_seq1:156-743(-)